MKKNHNLLLVLVVLVSLVLASCGGGTSNQQQNTTPIAPVTGSTMESVTGTPAGTGMEGSGTTGTTTPVADETDAVGMATGTVEATETGTTGGTDQGTGSIPVTGSFLSSKYLNGKVTASDATDLGTVQGLLVEAATGQIRYVVMGFGADGKLTLVPWYAFQRSSTSANAMTLDTVTAEQVAGGPEFNDQVFTESGANPVDLDTMVDEYWSGIVPAPAGDTMGSDSAVATATVQPTTSDTETTPTPQADTDTAVTETPGSSENALMYLRPFVNIPVRGADNNGLVGMVNDVIISEEGVVTYAVMTLDVTQNAGPGQVPVPWSAFTYNPEGGTLTLNVDVQQFSDAPRLDLINTPDMTAMDWDAEWQSFWQPLLPTQTP